MTPADHIDDAIEILETLKRDLYATNSLIIARETIREILEGRLQRSVGDAELAEFMQYDLAPSVHNWITECADTYKKIRSR